MDESPIQPQWKEVELLNQLFRSYDETGDMTVLEEAIKVARRAIHAIPRNHQSRGGLLNNLTILLGFRYKRARSMNDLEEAIILSREAVNATDGLQDPQIRSQRLTVLGDRLTDKYLHTKVLKDLEVSLQVMREAVDIIPQSHPGRASILLSRSTQLYDVYEQTGISSYLEESIDLTRQLINANLNHPDRVKWLCNLGCYLNYRYSETGELKDLEEAINITRESIDGTSNEHPSYSIFLNTLGILLGSRYTRMGTIKDLEEAIQVTRAAIDATPHSHPNYISFLNNLGCRLGERYLQEGATEDLEEAIQILRELIENTPHGSPDYFLFLNNLGVRLINKYSRTKDMADLDEAIIVAQGVVDSTPKDHPSRPGWLNNLGDNLSNKYLRTGHLSRLEDAIQVTRQAVDIAPENHTDRASYLNTLAIQLGHKYSRIGNIEDLEECISMAKRAVEITPQDHMDYAGWLNNLGIELGRRYHLTKAAADIQASEDCFFTALNQDIAPISDRIIAGRQILSSPFLQDTPKAYEAARTTIQLVPLLTPRSLRSVDKQHLLAMTTTLASDAAAVALKAGKEDIAAIEMLENGRGVLLGGLYDLRTDITALQGQYPDLARSFDDLRYKLDMDASLNNTSEAIEDPFVNAQTEANRRREASQQLESLIGEIRSQPGFERFLLAPSREEMQMAAENGPIVIINISLHRCDAFIIRSSGIRLVELPQLSLKDFESRSPESHDTLVWLWDTIVLPVLDHLGFVHVPPDGCWPHVWWIPTGPLVQFPLHAAGNHLRRCSETALDRVISSYSSSIRTIIHSHRRPCRELQENWKVAVVAMGYTPGLSQGNLRFAAEEALAVGATCKSLGIQAVWPEHRKKEVLSALETCQIFHFAGHGSTSPTSPLHSHLLLEDWQKDPLTVESLLTTNLSRKYPFLAYLSACGTGEIRDQRLTDEGIHLIAAYQIAGFRHVIGTLWNVDDRVCIDIATRTYGSLRKNGVNDESLSSGLHFALRELRDEWVQGKRYPENEVTGRSDLERNAKRRNAPIRGPLHWVPYVHFGI